MWRGSGPAALARRLQGTAEEDAAAAPVIAHPLRNTGEPGSQRRAETVAEQHDGSEPAPAKHSRQRKGARQRKTSSRRHFVQTTERGKSGQQLADARRTEALHRHLGTAPASQE